MFLRLALVAAFAATAMPAAHASEPPVCVVYPDRTQWIHVCSDPRDPDCLLYGALGLEGAFGGRGCERPPTP